MLSYLPGSDVTVRFALLDEGGVSLHATAVEYRVLDENGEEVVARVALAGWTASDEAEILIPGLSNALAVDTVRGMRMVEAYIATEDGEVLMSLSYMLDGGDSLSVPETSFQNYAQATFAAASMSDIQGWENASRQQRIGALIQARLNIVQLNFRMGAGNQTAIFPELYGRLEDFTAEEFDSLDAGFVSALQRAQVVEANAILGGDPVSDIRREGLLSKTIGESSMTYRQTKPLNLPVCERAMSYLARYVTWARRVGRS